MEPLSVNETLDHLDRLAGTLVCVVGLLAFEFEDVALYHVPTHERRGEFTSSIWLATGNGSLRFDGETCARWHGKRVVEGILRQHDPALGGVGCGHMGLSPAEITALTLTTKRQWDSERAGE